MKTTTTASRLSLSLAAVESWSEENSNRVVMRCRRRTAGDDGRLWKESFELTEKVVGVGVTVRLTSIQAVEGRDRLPIRHVEWSGQRNASP